MTIELSAISRHAARLLTAASLAVMLAGCYETPQVAEEHVPVDYRARHPITLQHGGLTAAERADVLAFAQQWRREATGGLVIEVPWGGPADRAVTDDMREIHSIFVASGVPQGAVYVRRFKPTGDTLASIRISYSKLTAHAGPCGLWPKDLGPAAGKQYLENREYWNLGCATQRNLAAEIDNPADLVQPRGEQPAFEPRRSVMLDKYTKGQSTSSTYSGYDKGKISDLGK
jgi:pilus assembly protein CpaD